jgi:hypothetical protein
MRNEETINIVNVKDLENEPHWESKDKIYILLQNKILICSFIRDHNDDNRVKEVIMVILNKNGDVTNFKVLKQKQIENYPLPYAFSVNATNILAHNKASSILEIYNFNLELIHSFKLDKLYFNFRVNGYDIMLRAL